MAKLVFVYSGRGGQSSCLMIFSAFDRLCSCGECLAFRSHISQCAFQPLATCFGQHSQSGEGMKRRKVYPANQSMRRRVLVRVEIHCHLEFIGYCKPCFRVPLQVACGAAELAKMTAEVFIFLYDLIFHFKLKTAIKSKND